MKLVLLNQGSSELGKPLKKLLQPLEKVDGMKNFYNDKELLSAYLDGELSQAEKNILKKNQNLIRTSKDLSDLRKIKRFNSKLDRKNF